MHAISPVYARVVVRELVKQGHPEAPLFAGTALNRQQLDSGGNIPASDFALILENARRMSGNPQLGLLIGRNCNVVTLGAVGAAMATAPTLREGLQILAHFTRLHTSYANIKLTFSLRLFSDLVNILLHYRARDLAEQLCSEGFIELPGLVITHLP